MTRFQRERICGNCLKRNTCLIIAEGSMSGCWESAVLTEEERYRDIIWDIVKRNNYDRREYL